jgi:hypothetical protein
MMEADIRRKKPKSQRPAEDEAMILESFLDFAEKSEDELTRFLLHCGIDNNDIELAGDIQSAILERYRRPSRYATPKVEECRSVDLVDLRRWRMLDPARISSTGKIPAVTWNTPDGFDKLGVIAQPRGVLFVRRDDGGELGKLFVPYVFTPTRFGGWRAWFRRPGCGQHCRVLYGSNSLRCRECRGLKYRSQYENASLPSIGAGSQDSASASESWGNR